MRNSMDEQKQNNRLLNRVNCFSITGYLTVLKLGNQIKQNKLIHLNWGVLKQRLSFQFKNIWYQASISFFLRAKLSSKVKAKIRGHLIRGPKNTIFWCVDRTLHRVKSKFAALKELCLFPSSITCAKIYTFFSFLWYFSFKVANLVFYSQERS